jgi:cyclase
MRLTRRDFLVTSVVAATAGRGARGLAQAPAAQAPTVTVFTDLRRGVGMFTARGGAIGFLVNSGGALAIDSQYPDTAPLFLQGFKARTPRSLSLILNTHHHADHTGGNQVFKAAGTRIVGHANCLEWHKRASATAGTDTQQAYADTTFTDQWRTEFGDEVVQARHYGPGHTGGDAVIHLEKANVVHMGDLLFHRAHPNIDRPSGARIANWIQLLEQVAAAHAADTIFIAGHARDNAVQCT